MAISSMMSALLFEPWVKVQFNMATFGGLSDSAQAHGMHKVNHGKMQLKCFITPKWCVLDLWLLLNTNRKSYIKLLNMTLHLTLDDPKGSKSGSCSLNSLELPNGLS